MAQQTHCQPREKQPSKWTTPAKTRLVGVSMIISGVTRVMLSLAVRKVADTTSSKLAA
jgi:hypothetical protein